MSLPCGRPPPTHAHPRMRRVTGCMRVRIRVLRVAARPMRRAQARMRHVTGCRYAGGSVAAAVEATAGGGDGETHIPGGVPGGVECVLMPGDVLFLPAQWWHLVECLTPAVSANAWLGAPHDVAERAREAVARALACRLHAGEAPRDWLAPRERAWSAEEAADTVVGAFAAARGAAVPAAGARARMAVCISEYTRAHGDLRIRIHRARMAICIPVGSHSRIRVRAALQSRGGCRRFLRRRR